MAETSTLLKLYRDENGRLRKTKSGHYRFDLITQSRDGIPYSSVMGFRLDYERKRILPITIQRGASVYVVAEIAPESHAATVAKLCEVIEEEAIATGQQ